MQISQRSLHNEPIFRLLLKVAVNGVFQCEFRIFFRILWIHLYYDSWALAMVPLENKEGRLDHALPVFTVLSVLPHLW